MEVAAEGEEERQERGRKRGREFKVTAKILNIKPHPPVLAPLGQYWVGWQASAVSPSAR